MTSTGGISVLLEKSERLAIQFGKLWQPLPYNAKIIIYGVERMVIHYSLFQKSLQPKRPIKYITRPNSDGFYNAY